MFESIKRFFARWRRIPRHKVPRWVRGKLYGQRYVTDRKREYKVDVKKFVQRNYRFAKQQGHWEIVHHRSDIPSGTSYFKEKTERWTTVKYYYRELK